MPVEAERGDFLDRSAAQLLVGVALGDPEDELAGGALLLRLRLRPERRAAYRVLELSARDVDGRHLVEAHGDVRAKLALDRRRELGREARELAVVHGAERDAVVVHTRDRVTQRKDLVATGVGEDRAVPTHERVEAAELADQVLAGSEVQVVRVPEDDRGAERPELVRVHALDRPLRADGHEGRRRHVAVRGAQQPRARGAVGRGDGEAVVHLAAFEAKDHEALHATRVTIILAPIRPVALGAAWPRRELA